MVSDNFQSPNAIPPRTSSTGLGISSNASPPNPTMPVLTPVPESTWIAQSKKDSPRLAPRTPPSSTSPDADTPMSADSVARHVNGTQWSPEKEKIVLGPFDYMYDHPGKDIRKQLIAAFNAWLQVPEDSVIIITKVVGMLHTASLLVDDVEDFSVLRRGIPVAHNLFGTAQTINSANYAYFGALQELLKLDNPKCIQIYTDELCNLHRGQGMDLFWRDTLTCPSEDDYLEMVSNKTGGLFRLAVKLMQAESNNGKDCVPLVNIIGLIFQIRDDYMNLMNTEYTDNKGLCEDLTEGKFSFPIIHSIRANQQNRQLINILAQKTKDEEVKKYAVKYMKGTGSFEYCKVILRDLHDKALKMVEEIDEGAGHGGGVKFFLDKLAV